VRLAGEIGKAEVHHLQVLLRSAGVDDHQVAGLEIPVDDRGVMRCLQGMAHPADQHGRPARVEPFLLLQ
jgi:hypothetical protein